MQCAVIEFARNVVGLEDANTTEFDRNCPHPVVCLLDEQYNITRQGRHHAAGLYPVRTCWTAARRAGAYGAPLIHERHRHRYEFNNDYREQFAANGLFVTGTSPDGKLVEVIELPGPSVVRGGAVPSGVQVEADAGPSAVPRLRQRRQGAPGKKKG